MKIGTTGTSPGSRNLWILLLLALALLPYIYQVCSYWHYTNDDAYITLRYGRNLSEGSGPYFNAGEHVEGYTSVLHMLQASLIIKCFGAGAAPAISKAAGVLYGAGCVILTFLLFGLLFRDSGRKMPQPLILFGALVSSAVVGISPSFAVNSTSGLETTMFSFWLIFGVVLGALELRQERWRASGVAFALAVLTRPEGSVLFGAYWIASAAAVVGSLHHGLSRGSSDTLLQCMTRSRVIRVLIANGLLVTLVFLVHMAIRYLVYDGEWLPNTFYAKQGGYWGCSAWSYLSGGLLAPLLGLAGGAIALTGLLVMHRRLPTGMVGVAVLALACGMLPYITGTDWMVGHRLVIPYLPVVAVALVSGWAVLLSPLRKLGIRSVTIMMAVVLVLLWVTQETSRAQLRNETLVRARGYETGHMAVARWIESKASPGECIALMDIGIIGYMCHEQEILDITGLTDRHIGKSEGTFLNKVYDPAYVLDRKPEFIVLTIFSEGRSYTPPPRGTAFNNWSEMEARLAQHPEFRRWYERKRAWQSSDGSDWLGRFAATIGADEVFEHGRPGLRYLLATFSRNTESNEIPSP